MCAGKAEYGVVEPRGSSHRRLDLWERLCSRQSELATRSAASTPDKSQINKPFRANRLNRQWRW